MTGIIQRHPIGAFLVVAYSMAIAIFAVPVLSDLGLGILPISLPGVAPFLLILTAALVGAVFAVTAIADGREGVRDLRRRLFRFRVSPVWYLLAVLVLPASAIAVAVALEGTAVLAAILEQPGEALTWMLNIALAFVLINLWEEFAWSGFVLHRLQRRMGPLRATVLTTWGHAAIHLPLLVVIGGVSDDRVPAEMYPFYLIALFIFPLGSRTVATWLYNRSGESVPIVGVAHAAWNLATGSALLPALAPGVDPAWSYAGFAAAAVILIAVTRGRLGRQATDPIRTTTSRAPVGAEAPTH